MYTYLPIPIELGPKAAIDLVTNNRENLGPLLFDCRYLVRWIPNSKFGICMEANVAAAFHSR